MSREVVILTKTLLYCQEARPEDEVKGGRCHSVMSATFASSFTTAPIYLQGLNRPRKT